MDYYDIQLNGRSIVGTFDAKYADATINAILNTLDVLGIEYNHDQSEYHEPSPDGYDNVLYDHIYTE